MLNFGRLHCGNRHACANTLNGLWLVLMIALAALYLSQLSIFAQLGISPLLVGIALGMFYGNTLRSQVPEAWEPGIVFSTKHLLRLAIVLYGFRVTFQQITAIGMPGLLVDAVVLASTLFLGTWAGVRLFRLDKETSVLCAAGSAICGAAAVLATEPVVRAESHKAAIAVATVVLFGTLGMFLFPLLYSLNLPITEQQAGIFLGATVHEVAQVVAAGNAISPETATTAVIVKMTRVMMLAPVLILLGIWWSRRSAMPDDNDTTQGMAKITIPWFAIGFIAVAGFNSLHLLPSQLVGAINDFDTLLLTIAMTALGMETNMSKLKGVGMKPFYLAALLFVWLTVSGAAAVYFLS